MRSCKLLVVGAGAAGISAAVAAWEAGCRDVLLVDRAAQPGGILPQCLHEGFGLAEFGKELTGPEYTARLTGRLASTGVSFLPETAVLSVSEDRVAVLSRRGELDCLHVERLILAAGCREMNIGALPVAGTRPAGIFTAGQVQEMINLRRQDPGDEVLILGSGDLGMIMARRLTLEGKRVIAVLEQAGQYGGMARNYHRCLEAFSIPLRCRMTVREIHGEGRICGVTCEHLDSGEREYLPCGTLVTALGMIPERELVSGLKGEGWLFPVGNASRVYDLVDAAAAQAAEVGRRVGRELAV
ncbi:MAG: NAD(P)/FAD-dependent oxidoreductase [Oscillospiraceae bacterium]|nr:NAD(P)/FAD-dependent oxidoreductase [Oscillospiraceae bacterium]